MDFVSDYKKYLKILSDPIRAASEKKYLYSDSKHFGVDSTTRRKYFKTIQKSLSELSKDDAINLALFAWSDVYFEIKCFALSILELHKNSLDLSDMPTIEKIMRESKGWAYLDSFIIPIMPGMLAKYPKTYDYLRKWIKDNDYWVRRSAFLSQLLFFREGCGGDKKLFFDMAVSQFDESWIDNIYKTPLDRKRARFFIRKAIGWTLREMSAHDPESVYEFVIKNKIHISGLTFREGTRKMPTKYKNLLK